MFNINYEFELYCGIYCNMWATTAAQVPFPRHPPVAVLTLRAPTPHAKCHNCHQLNPGEPFCNV